MLVRQMVDRGAPNPDKSVPGDLIAGNDNILGGALNTVGAGTILGAAFANGICYRTGPTGAYTDTTDTAVNILLAIQGDEQYSNVLPGTTFRFTHVNTVAYAMTLAAGVGVTLVNGVTVNAASSWREYIVTVLNSQPQVILQGVTTNSSEAVTFVFSGSQSAYVMGPNAGSRIITVGASVTGTGIPAGTTVAGITLGPGGIIGITLSANATATSASTGVALTIGPAIQIDGFRSGLI